MVCLVPFDVTALRASSSSRTNVRSSRSQSIASPDTAACIRLYHSIVPDCSSDSSWSISFSSWRSSSGSESSPVAFTNRSTGELLGPLEGVALLAVCLEGGGGLEPRQNKVLRCEPIDVSNIWARPATVFAPDRFRRDALGGMMQPATVRARPRQRSKLTDKVRMTGELTLPSPAGGRRIDPLFLSVDIEKERLVDVMNDLAVTAPHERGGQPGSCLASPCEPQRNVHVGSNIGSFSTRSDPREDHVYSLAQ